MDTSLLFISGMFRSGTTLLGRILNAHPKISVASDPYFDFFKCYRTTIGNKLGLRLSTTEPLGDYYFSSNDTRLLHEILNSDLDLPFNASDRILLTKELFNRAKTYSPAICKFLGSAVKGETYKELLDNLLDIMAMAYGKPGCLFIGFKEVWANEFIPALAYAYPEARFIQIIRDPRAVSASKNAKNTCYPWLFLGRQWRKLTALSWLNQQNHTIRERVLTLLYEDLVNDSTRTIKELCSFLKIEYFEAMARPDDFIDGSGQQWRQNTNYGVGGISFDTQATQRWKTSLMKDEQNFIVYLCYPEMALFGYNSDHEPQMDEDLLISPPLVLAERLAEWIKNAMPNNPLNTVLNLSHEKIRYALLNMKQDKFEKADEELVNASFLDLQIANAIRKIWAVT